VKKKPKDTGKDKPNVKLKKSYQTRTKFKPNVKLKEILSTAISTYQQEDLPKCRIDFSLDSNKETANESSSPTLLSPSNPIHYNFRSAECENEKLHKLTLTAANTSSTLSNSTNQLECYNIKYEEEAKPLDTLNSNILLTSTQSHFDKDSSKPNVKLKKSYKPKVKSKPNVKLNDPLLITILLFLSCLSQQGNLSKYRIEPSLELNNRTPIESSLPKLLSPSNPIHYNFIFTECESRKLHKLKRVPATIVSNTLSRCTNQLESYNFLNEEEAKPISTSNSNNLSVSTPSYFDRNLNFEQWMKHQYKEQLPN
jgi:hypothetical protein